MWLKEFAKTLKDNFPTYSIRTKEFPFFLVKLASFFDDSVKFIMPYWNRNIVLDNTKSISVLGMEYRDIQLTIVEGAQSMIECGLIVSKEKKKKNKGNDDQTEISSQATNQNDTVLIITDGKEEESKRSE